MANVVDHRGPNGGGYFVVDGVGIGMRRLGIVDLARGHQPIADEDGQVHVVFNGEIYNYRQLTRQLQRRGHTFASVSDT